MMVRMKERVLSKEVIFKEANMLLRNEYVFNGIWNMEPFDKPYSNKEKWDYLPVEDAEWIYMLNRFEYIYKLILAYIESKNEVYVKKITSLIESWYRDNHLSYGIRLGNSYIIKNHKKSNRTLDASIRIFNFTEALFFLEKNGYTNAKWKKKMSKWIHRDIVYIQSSRKEEKKNSNWSLIEDCNCLYVCEKLEIKNVIYNQILDEMKRQIKSDGSHIESSPMYLVQILIAMLNVLSINPMYLELERIAIKISDYLMSICNPNNEIPNFGDSDLTNISDVMIICWHVLKKERYLYHIDKNPEYEYILRYKINEHFVYNHIQKRSSISVLDSQIVYQSSRLYCLMSNTSRKSGHKHFDYCSLIFYVNNIPVLVDSGRYTYVDGEKRKFFVGPSAHNVVCVNEEESYTYLDSWNIKEKIKENSLVIKCLWNNENEIGTYMTYSTSQYRVHRIIITSEEFGLIICDTVDMDEELEANIYFNFSPYVEIERVSPEKFRLFVQNIEMLFCGTEDGLVQNSFYSEKYNLYDKTKKIKFNMHNSVHFTSLLFEGYTSECCDCNNDIKIEIHNGESEIVKEYVLLKKEFIRGK